MLRWVHAPCAPRTPCACTLRACTSHGVVRAAAGGIHSPSLCALTGLCAADAEERPFVASMGIYVFKKQARQLAGAGGRGPPSASPLCDS